MILFGENEREQEKEVIFATLLKDLDEAIASLDYSNEEHDPYDSEDPHSMALGRFYARLVELALNKHYRSGWVAEHDEAGAFFNEKMSDQTAHWQRTSRAEHNLLLIEFVRLHVWPRIEQLLAIQSRTAEAAKVKDLWSIEETPTLGVQSLLFPLRS